MRVRARPQGLSRAGAPSTLHSSVLQHDTGRVRPMPSTSEGTHLLAQDLVTVASPRKGYTVDMKHQREDGPHAACRTPCGVIPSVTQLPVLPPTPAEPTMCQGPG